jgi:integrase
MSREKKVFPSFRVYSPSDLSKKWFVYWYEGSRRIRKYGDINKYHTENERHRAAKLLIESFKQQHLRRVTNTEEAVRAFIKREQRQWREKTIQQYESTANILFDFLDGREIDQELLNEFLQEIKDTRHPTTYNRYIVITRRLLTAAGYKLLFDDVAMVKAQKTPARYFQSHQATRLMKYMAKREPELALFCQFIYFTFIRPGELRLLKVGDILFDEKEIRVPGRVSKNRKTEHVVIPDAFAPCLEYLYDRGPGEYLFPSTTRPGEPYSKAVMYRRHEKVLSALNFGKGFSLYSWKHTGAVALVKQGNVNVKELQLQLRHSSLEQTDRYLRQMGVKDLGRLRKNFPTIWK